MPDGERVTTGSEPRTFTEADVERAQEAIYRAFPAIDPRSDMRQFIRVILGSVVDEQTEDEWKRKALDYHRALSEGYGVEDGGVWEDRALTAEAALVTERERTVAAVVEALREEREPQFNLAATWIENDPRFKPSAPGGNTAG